MAFALFEIDVGVELRALHFLDEVAQAIGLAVEIGVVDLEDVAG